MFETLKILHFLALAVGLGGGLSNAVVGAVVGPKDPALAGAVQRRIGRASFLALLVLWASGLAMALGGLRGGGLSVGPPRPGSGADRAAAQ